MSNSISYDSHDVDAQSTSVLRLTRCKRRDTQSNKRPILGCVDPLVAKSRSLGEKLMTRILLCYSGST
jgi:hypothetical protein